MHETHNNFLFANFEGRDPSFVNQFNPSLDLDDSSFWTMHLRVRIEHYRRLDATYRYMRTMLRSVPLGSFPYASEEGYPPAMVGGDSFEEWGEKYQGGNYALHVYFHARGRDEAASLALSFAERLGIGWHDCALSTAGDWSQQTPIHRQQRGPYSAGTRFGPAANDEDA